ncbi:MAG: TIGR01906 family membrane protein [Candidatus Izimaplasma sp.]|nr:TIGR01906 family membrane protein [Candidatus Izimaplasma bacterium]
MKKTSKVLLSITVPVVVVMLIVTLLTSKPYLTLSKGLYASHDDIYYDHDYAIERIIGYLNYEYDTLYFGLNEDDNSVIMRDVEIRHMKDVLDVYTELRVITIGCLLISVGIALYLLRKDKEFLKETFKNLYKGPLIFIGIVGAALIIDFNLTFTLFHQLFFDNNDWLLRYDDVLILLLPSNFWLVSGLIVLLGLGFTLGLINILIRRISK